MVERTPILDTLTYVFLMVGICIVGFPIFYTFVAATLPIEEVAKVPMPLVPGDQFWVNMTAAWEQGNLSRQLLNSFVMASGITIGKIVVSMLGAFSIVYFDYRFRKVAFAAVFCTLMLPVEVRILPTYEIAANIFGPLQWLLDTLHLSRLIEWWIGNDFEIALEWSLLDSYSGLILPLVASATCTFLFRQFFLTVPEELCDGVLVHWLDRERFDVAEGLDLLLLDDAGRDLVGLAPVVRGRAARQTQAGQQQEWTGQGFHWRHLQKKTAPRRGAAVSVRSGNCH